MTYVDFDSLIALFRDTRQPFPPRVQRLPLPPTACDIRDIEPPIRLFRSQATWVVSQFEIGQHWSRVSRHATMKHAYPLKQEAPA